MRKILHILVWAVFLALPVYSARRFQMGIDFLLIYYTFAAVNILIFYSNYLLLVPWLYFKKRKYSYYISVLFLVFCFYFISDFANNKVINFISDNRDIEQTESGKHMQSDSPGRRLGPPQGGFLIPRIPLPYAHLIGYTSSSLFMIFLSLGIRVLERQSKIEKMQEDMEKAKLNAELAFLKNQISPHFFFNTLNNIYSLIGINTVDSQKAVLKLSKLMRYLLYESEHGNTRLSHEIDFMNNYIDLMKLRMSDRVSLAVDFPLKPADISIPPLLFIPFIENAFKHGITTRGGSFIDISLSSTPEVLIFKCSNSITGKKTSDKQPGIGLENVKKRLALLYPERHQLSIDKKDDEFRVVLKISLT